MEFDLDEFLLAQVAQANSTPELETLIETLEEASLRAKARHFHLRVEDELSRDESKNKGPLKDFRDRLRVDGLESSLDDDNEFAFLALRITSPSTSSDTSESADDIVLWWNYESTCLAESSDSEDEDSEEDEEKKGKDEKNRLYFVQFTISWQPLDPEKSEKQKSNSDTIQLVECTFTQSEKGITHKIKMNRPNYEKLLAKIDLVETEQTHKTNIWHLVSHFFASTILDPIQRANVQKQLEGVLLNNVTSTSLFPTFLAGQKGNQNKKRKSSDRSADEQKLKGNEQKKQKNRQDLLTTKQKEKGNVQYEEEVKPKRNIPDKKHKKVQSGMGHKKSTK
eukprot:TRINITY_DN15294_c0_g1_i1.p1 TRINITY_DN15294_c0_g1~~TRINITY_DN15294_c0_g1_i1.p1  ORF type:complete len:337 (+),score=98.22 TRINITY_DN15294_c0_g1_i1:36-1046(+)